MEGHTSAGAKSNIWDIYSSDIRLPRPTDRTLLTIVLHRELTLPARLDSSPEENLRKKLTGRDRIRIITDASTACDVFVLIRSISRFFTRLISWLAKALLSRNTAIPIIRLIFRVFMTFPVTRLYTLGSIMPTSTTARDAIAIRMMSPVEMLFFIYSSRSGMPSFFMGSG